MLTYSISLGAIGGRLFPELADALRRSSIMTVEVPILTFDQDDRAGRPSRRLLRGLISEGAIRAGSLHLPFGGGWDISVGDEGERKRVVSGLADLIDRSVEFQSRNLTLHASFEPIPEAERPLRMRAARRSLEALVPFAAARGFRVAVELLPRTCLGRHEDELLSLVDGFDPAAAGICFDVNHVMNRQAEIPRMIEAMTSRLSLFHISDHDGLDEQHWYPGQGVIPWPAVMRAIRATGLDLILIYETGRQAAAKDPVEAVRLVEENIPFLENAHEIAD
jgi:sugar phosphate isomerase/epimerase